MLLYIKGGLDMRRIHLIGICLITFGCSTTNEEELIANQIAQSKEAFNRAIPADWSPENYAVRVIQDYRSNGSTGVVAMDSTNTIVTFEICEKNDKKCYRDKTEEVIANCKNTVALGNNFDILNNIPVDCRLIIVNNKIVDNGVILEGITYSKGDNI